jgi:hypothetical protein
MPEEIKTDAAGAVPADKGAKAGLPTDENKDAKADSSPEVVNDKDGKPLPWDKQPKWVAARAAERKLEALLKANDLTDPDDLLDLVQRGKVVKGKLADLNDLDDVIKDAEEIRRYRPIWRENEERERRNTEDPNETIKRLEAKDKARDAAENRKRAEAEHTENMKKTIMGYESEVDSLIRELEVPKDQRAFFLEFFGVGNPCNDINLTDRKAIKKLVADGVKKKEAYDQAVIKAYLESKRGIPKINSAAGASANEPKKIMTLKDRRNMFLERMQSASGG